MEVKQIIECLQSLSPEDKDNFLQSKMFTNITATNLQSMNLENIQKDFHSSNQIPIRQGTFSKKPEIVKGKEEQEDMLQVSMFQKLNGLQQKSSRMISLFPCIGSRMLNGNSLINQYPETMFGVDQDQISNKLKIIRSLEDKISQLELNISNPNVCQEYIGNIQKQINLNFQNYYQEVKESSYNPKAQKTQFNRSFDSKESLQESQKLQASQFSRQNLESFDICVCVPKIIEIEIPVAVLKTKQVAEDQSSQEWKKRSESQKLRVNKNSRSKSENGDKKNSSGSSIENIINQFAKKFNYELNERQIMPYSQNEPGTVINFTENHSPKEPLSPEIGQKHQFNLPLDSFQKVCGELNQERQQVKKTDRSKMSSQSQLQKIRDQFWNKDHFEFNQQYLSQVKQTQQKSHNQSFLDNHRDLGLDSRQDCIQEGKLSKNSALALDNTILLLRQQLSKKTVELEECKQIKSQLESRQLQRQAQLSQLAQKYSNLEVINENLKRQLNQKQEELAKQQNLQINFADRLKQHQAYFSIQIQHKDAEIHQIMQVIKDKNDEIQESTKIQQQLKQLLQAKERQLQTLILKTDSQISELRQEIEFYKRKLEEQGINFNIEEASIIKDLIQITHMKQIVDNGLHQKCTYLTEQLKKQKINSLKNIEQLKKENQKLSKLAFLSQEDDVVLEQSIKTIIQNYNLQLVKKQEEINHLRKTAQKAQFILKQTSNTFDYEVATITSIKNLLLSDSQKNQDQSLHFVYIVNRLIRHLKLYEYNLVRQKEQRIRVTKKLSELNLYIGKSIQKSQKRAERLEQQNIRYKKQHQELSSQLRKLTAKFNAFKAKIASSEKESLNIIQLEKDFLQVQNKKLTQKCKKVKNYAEQLQQKIIDQLVFLGNSPCEHFCSIITQKQQNQKEQLDEHQSSLEKVSQVKQSSKQGSLISYFVDSKLKKIKNSLTSSVISYTNKVTKILPKAILAPLPKLPSPKTTLPASLTLDKLLAKRMWWTSQVKIRFILKLLDLCAELIKVNRKLFHLKPCQMLISGLQGEIEIVIRREYSCVSQEQDQANLLYRAPQVLLGFTQSEASYVWSVGVIIDQIYHQKLFFKKLNDILSRKENYEVIDSTIAIKPLLQSMLRKKQKQRPSLSKIRQQILMLQSSK